MRGGSSSEIRRALKQTYLHYIPFNRIEADFEVVRAKLVDVQKIWGSEWDSFCHVSHERDTRNL